MVNSTPSSSQNMPFLRTRSPLSIRRKATGIGCLVLIPTTLSLIFLSAGLGTFFLLWLTILKGVNSKHALTSGAFLVNEGQKVNWDSTRTATLLGLSITTVTTHVVSATAPFLVSFTAYCTAALWLKRQVMHIANDSDLPTPLQYGLLFELLSSSGLKAMYDCVRYFLQTKKRGRVSHAVLIPGFVFVLVIYLITHFIIFTDLWIHSTTFATLQNLTTSIPNPDLYRFGAAFDEQLCDLIDGSECIFPANPDVPELNSTLAKGLNITSNAVEPQLSVVTLQNYDDLAVVVSTADDGSISYTAPSFGARATCRTITAETKITQTKDAPDVDITFSNISSRGPVTLHISDESVVSKTFGLLLAAVDSGGVQLTQDLSLANSTPVQFTSDPPTMVVLFLWPGSAGFSMANNFLVDDSFGLWGAAQCGMEFFNLTIHRNSISNNDQPQQASEPEYSLEGTPTRNKGSFVATMWSPLLSQRANIQFAFSLYSNDFSQPNETLVQLSRAALGMFAGTLKPVSVNTIIEEVILGRYPVVPVLTYVGLLVVYSPIALGIFLWAALLKTPGISMPGSQGKTATALQLAQVQLTDPLIVVAQSFERELKRGEEKRIETSEVGGTESQVEEGVMRGPVMDETNEEEDATVENEETFEVESKGLTKDYVRTESSIATDGLELFQEDQDTMRLVLSLGSRGLRLRVRQYRKKAS
ncbi:hypothetical protein BDN72DRAFT_850598 [Pluteus cervinus]|uniref:Uncharacterized protein n=1 Tax=Pluteus cervinus TaxID=181527 RepID=A0ACD3A3U2_9AGAR|nr:hypothetical protein BDN72DRAFT_850598 [Pluteus cervinus]